MANVAVVTDTSADLTPQQAAAAGVHLVPLTVRFGDDTYEAGIELSNERFYELLTAPGAPFPRTAAPNPDRFRRAYEDALANGAEAVLCVTIGSRLSSTHDSAVQAAREMQSDSVRVVDSQTTTHALGIIAMELAERAADGATLAELADLADDLVARTDIIFAVDTLEYLQKGGRIGRASALLGSALRIKPILRVIDGEVATADRPRTSARARARLLELATERPVERATVLHTLDPRVDVLREEFVTASGLDGARVDVGLTGPVAGSHVGPGTLGVALLLQR